MAITVDYYGRFHCKISNVAPRDIILGGKILYVKGIKIPVIEDRLYDVFYFLEKEARNKYGKVILVFLENGNINYVSTTSNDKAEYYMDKVLRWGSDPIISLLHKKKYVQLKPNSF